MLRIICLCLDTHQSNWVGGVEMDDKVLLQGDKSLLEGLVESPFRESHQKKKSS